MLGRWTKGLLHLLVGGACAALVAWLVFGFSQTVLHTHGPVRLTMMALVAGTLVFVAWLLLAPPVRPAEVALARALLDVDLPEPADTTSWGARWRGLLWATVVIGLGGLSLLALLWCLPQGAAIFLVALGVDPGLLPPALGGLPAVLLAAVGLLLAAAGVVLQPVLVSVLTSLAPRVLGPTPGDRLAHAEQERQALLRANELARELHDSVGHSLTAIGVQAEAGARVAGTDPDFAREALDQIARTTRQAVAELDEVLGDLRRGPDDGHRPVPVLADLLGPRGELGSHGIRLEVPGELDEGVARTAYRVVQEALSNARRHGAGEPAGHVRLRDGWVEVLVENPVETGGRGAGTGGRGLVGMRERLALVGGTLEAGPHRVDGRAGWRLLARLPAETGTGS